MSTAPAHDAIIRLAAIDIDAGQPDFQPAMVIDRFNYWHNQPDSLLAPTSITWGEPVSIAGRVA